MGLLSPSQRKSFTINKDTATFLASKLANGETLRFQSSANRNWVAKIARTRYGVATKVRASKDQLFDPSRTVDGGDLRPGNEHYMTLYVAERDYNTYDAPLYRKPVVHVGNYSRYAY